MQYSNSDKCKITKIPVSVNYWRMTSALHCLHCTVCFIITLTLYIFKNNNNKIKEPKQIREILTWEYQKVYYVSFLTDA